MSTSALRDIVQAIADLPVPYDGSVVPVRIEGTLPQMVEMANTPLRIIPTQDGISVSSAKPMTMSRGILARWRIMDILLAREVGMGTGVRDVGALLIDYLDDYVRALRTLTPVPSDYDWDVIDVDGRITVVRYAERQYDGVVMTLTVAHTVRP